MDAYEFDYMKREKAKAMFRFNLLQTIWKTFRFIELCLVVILISWFSAHLPFAVRISAEYIRRLVTVVVSPIFVFAVSNAIVFALLFKTGQNPTVNNAESDLHNEIANKSETESDLEPENQADSINRESKEIAIYQDKQVLIEAKSEYSEAGKIKIAKEPKKLYRRIQSEKPMNKTLDKQVLIEAKSEYSEAGKIKKAEETKKLYRRIQSEKPMNKTLDATCNKKLRRSETEIRQKRNNVEPITVPIVDELSNEEFQQTIEAFIAKQVKFHQEEKSVIATC